VILHRLEIDRLGPFRTPVLLGPFAPGLNVLAAPNESGKSTAFVAAARALFDRHDSKAKEIRALQPVGTDLGPRVRVDFETSAGVFRVEKTFLASPTSRLCQQRASGWDLLAEGDAADDRLRELLRSEAPGGGATKPAHWGLLNVLWARQGEPADWPLEALHRGSAENPAPRDRLARVPLDPATDRSLERLRDLAEPSLTSTGRVRANGPLDLAQRELDRLHAELAELRAQATAAEGQAREFGTAQADVDRLEQEERDLAAQAEEAVRRASAIERTREEIRTREAALQVAKRELLRVQEDVERLAEWDRQEESSRRDRAQAEAASRQASTALERALAGRTQARDAQAQAQRAAQAARASEEAARTRLQARQARERADTLLRQFTRAEQAEAERRAARAALDTLPNLTPASLAKLEKAQDQLRQAEAAAAAVGVELTLTPDAPTEVEPVHGQGTAPRREQVAPDRPLCLRDPRRLEVVLPGWGRVAVRADSAEAEERAEQRDQARTDWHEALIGAGVPGLVEARAALRQRQEATAALRLAEQGVKAALDGQDDLEALRRETEKARRQAEALEQLAPSLPEGPDSLAALENAVAEATGDRQRADRAARAAAEALEQHDEAEREARTAVEAAAQAQARREADAYLREVMRADVLARHPGGLDAALRASRQGFVEAEARWEQSRAQLPDDHERIPAQARRLQAAREEVRTARQARQSARDAARGALEHLGGRGLYAKESALEERRTVVVGRLASLTRQAFGARLAQHLLAQHRQAALQRVLSPLEDQLSAVFASLTEQPGRRVFLTPELAVEGIGESRAALYPFDRLSQGAREQLLLCLRLAVAREAARDERQTLWLDDVLVNTDPARQARVLDLLQTAAAELQIIVLTCHPDRYRGVGTPVPWARPTP
jgi:DNA repair exonuclease SbcCD ATPase subunit